MDYIYLSLRQFCLRRLIFFAVVLCLVCTGVEAKLVKVDTDTSLRAVYLFSDPDLKKITVYPVIIAGESDFQGPEGLAHYLEHLMFWHADKVKARSFHGRRGNAWANGWVTGYFNVGEREELDDMFSFAGRLLTEPTLNRRFMLDERKVVAREYDFRVSENPRRQIWPRVWSLLLGENPAERSVIGTPQSIAALTLDHAKDFHKKFYNPANTVLLVSGNISPQEVKARTEAVFGEYPAGQANRQLWRTQPPQGAVDETLTVSNRQVRGPAVAQGVVADWAGRGYRPADAAIMQLLNRILISALDGSLAKPLRIDQFVFRSFDIEIWSVIDGQAMAYFYGRLDDGVTADEGRSALSAALKDLSSNGIPQVSLDRVRKRMITRIDRLSVDDKAFFKRASQNLSLGFSPETVDVYKARLNDVTKADIDGLLQALAMADRRVSVKFLPPGE